MGGKRNFNKFAQKKRDKKEAAKNSRPKDDGRRHYVEIVRENAAFETYYKAQNICPPEEWDAFMKSIKENLPTAFRITGSRGESDALLGLVQGRLFQDLANVPAEEKEQKPSKPVCLPWYPGNLAWQLALTRSDIRRSEAHYRLHNFLTAETSAGSISRQETVSMIPPIALAVLPHHRVLDMCASPGSKTAQLIEFLHAGEDGKKPTGFVMANDVDNNRCYMLVHQAKRLNSPCILITNHDGQFIPNLTISDSLCTDGKVNGDGSGSRLLKFDRILCDVPCSGDGTLRKNPDIWLKWSAGNGNNLHGIQYRIAHRGAELLSVGGRLAYSTCSFNPLECEAVVLRLLREAKGALRLLDIAQLLPGLKFAKGLSHWRPASKDLEFFDRPEDVPEKWNTVVRPQMFPPTAEEGDQYHLDKCLRVLPHHQDTGGFFVAVLEKVSLLPFEKKETLVDAGTVGAADKKEDSAEKTETIDENGDNKAGEESKDKVAESKSAPWGPQRKRRKMGGYKEDPYVFFSGEQEDVFPSIKGFYHLTDDFDPKCLLTRCHVGKKKNIYLVSPIVKDVVQRNEEKVKIINTGVKTFVRCDNKNMSCPFRLSQEGLPSIIRFVGAARSVSLPREDLVLLLHNDNPHAPPDLELLTPQTQEKVKDFPSGSCVLRYESPDLQLCLVGWRGVRSLRAYTAQPDTIHMLRLLGEDTSKFDVNKFKKVDESADLETADPETVKEDPVDVAEEAMVTDAAVEVENVAT